MGGPGFILRMKIVVGNVFTIKNGRVGLFGYVFTLKNGRVGFHPPNELVFGYVFTLKMGGSGFILR